MPTYCYRERDAPEGEEPRVIEDFFWYSERPSSIERDGVTYDHAIGLGGCVTKIISTNLCSIQMEPGAGRDFIHKVKKGARWSYTKGNIPVFTSNEQRREFCKASEGQWHWNNDV